MSDIKKKFCDLKRILARKWIYLLYATTEMSRSIDLTNHTHTYYIIILKTTNNVLWLGQQNRYLYACIINSVQVHLICTTKCHIEMRNEFVFAANCFCKCLRLSDNRCIVGTLGIPRMERNICTSSNHEWHMWFDDWISGQIELQSIHCL